MKQLAERTGAAVSREHAAAVRSVIQARPAARVNPHAYLIRVLVTDPNPHRWLPEGDECAT